MGIITIYGNCLYPFGVSQYLVTHLEIPIYTWECRPSQSGKYESGPDFMLRLILKLDRAIEGYIAGFVPQLSPDSRQDLESNKEHDNESL